MQDRRWEILQEEYLRLGVREGQLPREINILTPVTLMDQQHAPVLRQLMDRRQVTAPVEYLRLGLAYLPATNTHMLVTLVAPQQTQAADHAVDLRRETALEAYLH